MRCPGAGERHGRPAGVAAIGALMLAAVVAACGSGGATAGIGSSPAAGTSRASADPGPAGSVGPVGNAASAGSGGSAAGTTSSPATGNPGRCARQLLARLSANQRIGQLFIVGVPTATPPDPGIAAALDADAGGYQLFGGSSAGVSATARLTARVSAALTSADGGVRPFVAVDQEGGQVQALTGDGFDPIPSALQQGTWSPAALTRAVRVWGAQLRSAGVNLDFAPVVDVVPARLGRANVPIGGYDREFGHEPAVVAEHGAATVAALASQGVLSAAKHFPGLGRVTANTDTNVGVTDSVTDSQDASITPFAAAARAGAGFVMMSLATYPRIDRAHPAVFSARVIELLRGRIGFTGLVISDDLGSTAQVAYLPPGGRAITFLSAGGQVVLVTKPPGVVAAMTGAVLAAERSDPGFAALVDADVRAVLATKLAAGLVNC